MKSLAVILAFLSATLVVAYNAGKPTLPPKPAKLPPVAQSIPAPVQKPQVKAAQVGTWYLYDLAPNPTGGIASKPPVWDNTDPLNPILVFPGNGGPAFPAWIQAQLTVGQIYQGWYVLTVRNGPFVTPQATETHGGLAGHNWFPAGSFILSTTNIGPN
jgi:hypothetical protein